MRTYMKNKKIIVFIMFLIITFQPHLVYAQPDDGGGGGGGGGGQPIVTPSTPTVGSLNSALREAKNNMSDLRTPTKSVELAGEMFGVALYVLTGLGIINLLFGFYKIATGADAQGVLSSKTKLVFVCLGIVFISNYHRILAMLLKAFGL